MHVDFEDVRESVGVRLGVVISAFIARFLWGTCGSCGKAGPGRGFFQPTDATTWLAFQRSAAQIAVIGLGGGLLGGQLWAAIIGVVSAFLGAFFARAQALQADPALVLVAQ